MGIGYNTSIVRDGLVFHYDMANTSKSWKGKPTTNLLNTNLGSYAIDGSGQASIGTRTIQSDGSVFIEDVNSNTRLSNGTLPISINTSYTVSVKFKKESGTPTFRWQIQGKNASNGIVTTYWTNGQQNSVQDIYGWQTISYTFSFTDPTITQVLIWFQDGADYTTYTHSYYLKEPQLEVGSFATPYVNGTRSNTQAIVDLTKNSTITANSLTYNSDNTFSFDGSTQDISVTMPQIFAGSVSFEAMCYFDLDNTRDVLFGNYNSPPGVNFERDTSNRLRLWWNEGTNNIYSSTGVAPAGEWLHVVIIRNKENGTFDFYVNGNLVSQPSVTSADLPSVPSLFRIGRDYRTDFTMLGGKMPMIKVYQKALTASEVKQNFEAIRWRYGI